MGRVVYNIERFNGAKALRGALCLVVTKGYSKQTIANIDVAGIANKDFIGAGICRSLNSSTLYITIAGVQYDFDINGTAMSSNALNYKLVLGVVEKTISEAGNAVKSDSTVSTLSSRAGDTETVETTIDYTKPSDVMVESLNARDQFAINVLKEMLGHIPDPSVLSNSEMDFYCNMAYQWAANMMTAAANVRGSFKKEGSTNANGSVDVSVQSLTSDTDKLLNNLIVALQRTDTQGTEGGQSVYMKYIKLLNMDKLTEAVQNIDLDAIDIGDGGLGRDKDHPIHVTGGAFPSRQALAASLTATVMNDFLTFNKDGAVGYSTLTEVKKAVLGYLADYKDLDALAAAVYEKLQGTIQTAIDTRVKGFLNKTTVTVGGQSYNLNVPESI